MMDRKVSRIGWRLLLALVLLLVQQAGLRHNLSHATSRDESAPTHAVCLDCLALHASADSITPVVPALALLAHAHVLAAATAQHGAEPRTERVYESRAPPASPA